MEIVQTTIGMKDAVFDLKGMPRAFGWPKLKKKK